MDGEQLLMEAEPIVRKLARRLIKRMPSELDVEDLEQAARLALWESRGRLSELSGDHFTAYVVTRARGAMIDLRRSIGWLPRSARTREDWDRAHMPSYDAWENFADLRTDGEGSCPSNDLALKRAVQKLRPRLRSVLELLVMGLTPQEVAATQGVTPSRVTQLVNEIREVLARHC